MPILAESAATFYKYYWEFCGASSQNLQVSSACLGMGEAPLSDGVLRIGTNL